MEFREEEEEEEAGCHGGGFFGSHRPLPPHHHRPLRPWYNAGDVIPFYAYKIGPFHNPVYALQS